jgi:cyclic pyranopterin phosphate synthase
MTMIDISNKEVTSREAVVEGKIILSPEVILRIKNKDIPKGDVLEVSRIAGILAAKKTPDALPLCHPIPLEAVSVDFSVEKSHILVTSKVKGNSKTGVEMEAFHAVSVACLNIYDMCKAFDREAIISDIRLIKKQGGKSGTYARA